MGINILSEEKRRTYHELRDQKNILLLREVLQTMPEYAKEFFRSSSNTRSANTTVKYAYAVRTFLEFLLETNPSYKGRTLKDLTLEDLDRVTALDIEEYMDYLKAYQTPGQEQMVTNGEKGIKQKMSALRVFYAYYYRHRMISTNPTALVDMPKLHEKEIVRLDADEVADLLDLIENGGDTLSPHQKAYWEKTKVRDAAIVTLLLGTGIRVSECVGLDLEDVDFRNNGIKVYRKGGNEMMVYFGNEVEKALRRYIEEDRAAITPVSGHEHALFYSSQRRRIGVKAVENLVRKYTRLITQTKKITPHKLRSTYGTALYQETGDIYLVADVLGHKDVNTTKKHYAAIDDARRRKAAGAVKLRED